MYFVAILSTLQHLSFINLNKADIKVLKYPNTILLKAVHISVKSFHLDPPFREKLYPVYTYSQLNVKQILHITFW